MNIRLSVALMALAAACPALAAPPANFDQRVEELRQASETPGMAIVQRRFAACTALGLAVSEAVRHWAIREYALAPRRMEVLYNGHDVDRFASAKPNARAGVRQELAIAPDAALIGLIGRVLTAQKGQDLMIRLMPEVLTRRSDAVLLIVGEGPDLQDCEALAAGHHQAVEQELRPFFVLPFMHSETLEDQELSVELSRPLGETLKHAMQHRDIVRKFGRFPHRNAMLGRITTPDEQAFLDAGGFAG